jgi:hypothetical protein
MQNDLRHWMRSVWLAHTPFGDDEKVICFLVWPGGVTQRFKVEETWQPIIAILKRAKARYGKLQ